MKTSLALVVVGILFTGCCIPKRHAKHRCTPLPSGGSPAPVVAPVAPPPVRTETPSTVATTTSGETRLELKTEDLSVQKNTVSNGAARIRKYVVSEQRSIPVVTCKEDFVVERIPAGGAPTTPWGNGEVVFELPLTRETVTPVVTPRVVEVLRVRKTIDCETNNVTATIRTEKAEVVRQ